MATDYDALIAKLEAAIDKRLAGDVVSEWTIRGRNVRYEPIDRLYELLQSLKRDKAVAASGGLPAMVSVPGRPGPHTAAGEGLT